MLMINRRFVTLVSVAAAAFVTVALLAISGPTTTARSAATPTGELRDAIPALKRPAAPGDIMPADASRMLLTNQGDDRAGVRSFASVTGRGYLVPRDTGLCIAIPDPVDGYGKVCVPTEVAVRQGVAAAMSDRAHWDSPTIAIAPPVGATVEAIAQDGTATRLDVNSDGVVSTNLQRGTQKVRVTGPDGIFDLPMPAVPPPAGPLPGQKPGDVVGPAK